MLFSFCSYFVGRSSSTILCLLGFCVWSLFFYAYLASFLVCNHLAEEENVGCFINCLCIVTVSVLWLFLTEPWADYGVCYHEGESRDFRGLKKMADTCQNPRFR